MNNESERLSRFTDEKNKEVLKEEVQFLIDAMKVSDQKFSEELEKCAKGEISLKELSEKIVPIEEYKELLKKHGLDTDKTFVFSSEQDEARSFELIDILIEAKSASNIALNEIIQNFINNGEKLEEKDFYKIGQDSMMEALKNTFEKRGLKF